MTLNLFGFGVDVYQTYVGGVEVRVAVFKLSRGGRRCPRQLFNMALVIIMALTVAVTPASARRKMFPANHGSVALENSYANQAGIARHDNPSYYRLDFDT